MPSITLNLNVENAPNPARKHFEKTNIQFIFQKLVQHLKILAFIPLSTSFSSSPPHPPSSLLLSCLLSLYSPLLFCILWFVPAFSSSSLSPSTPSCTPLHPPPLPRSTYTFLVQLPDYSIPSLPLSNLSLSFCLSVCLSLCCPPPPVHFALTIPSLSYCYKISLYSLSLLPLLFPQYISLSLPPSPPFRFMHSSLFQLISFSFSFLTAIPPFLLLTNASIYNRNVCLSICPSRLEERGGGGRQQPTRRVDRKEGGNEEGDFYDGMPGWTYFS